MSDPVVAFIYHKITGRGVFRNLSQGGGAQHLLGPKTPLEISDFTERPPPRIRYISDYREPSHTFYTVQLAALKTLLSHKNN